MGAVLVSHRRRRRRLCVLLAAAAAAAAAAVVLIWDSFFFFGGLSLHLSSALLAHLLSIDVAWGATKKEVERSNFFIEVPRILRRYWVTFGMCGAAVVAAVVLATPAVPPQWRVEVSSWAVIVPLMYVFLSFFIPR